jgi:4-hydroxy-L-threonine phosphate dehydrogenase PdxA
MTSLIIAAVVGLVVGIGGTIGIQQATKPKEETKPLVVAVGGDEVAKGQTEVQKKLVDLDLLVEPCSKEFIKDQKDSLLCREMFCRMQQRGIDAQTSQTDCESISNIANTKAIKDACKNLKDDELTACTELFFRRK